MTCTGRSSQAPPFSHVSVASSTPPPIARPLSEICRQSVSARGSTSPIFSPAGTSLPSATSPRTRPANGARTSMPSTVPRTVPAATTSPMRACHLAFPAAGGRSTPRGPPPPSSPRVPGLGGAPPPPSGPPPAYPPGRPGVGRAGAAPEPPAKLRAAHGLDDRVTVAARREPWAERHDERRALDGRVEQALGHPRVDHHVGSERRQPGGDDDGHQIRPGQAGRLGDSRVNRPDPLHDHRAVADGSRKGDGAPDGERPRQLAHRHAKPGSLEPPGRAGG